MIGHLTSPDEPVVPGLEQHETVVELEHLGKRKLRTLQAETFDHRVLSKWVFTPEQRAAVAAGANLYMVQMKFQQETVMPTQLFIADKLSSDFVRRDYELPSHLSDPVFRGEDGFVKVDLQEVEERVIAALLAAGHLVLVDKLLSGGAITPEEKQVINNTVGGCESL